MNDEDDLALSTLLTTKQETASDLSDQLLEACYAIQARHQFNEDRTVSTNAIERLIDEEVTRLSL